MRGGEKRGEVRPQEEKEERGLSTLFSAGKENRNVGKRKEREREKKGGRHGWHSRSGDLSDGEKKKKKSDRVVEDPP